MHILKSISVLSLATLINIADVYAAETSIEITPLIGYRFGGDFDVENSVSNSNSTIKLVEGNSYGLIVAWPYTIKQQGELLVSHYKTEFNQASLTNNVNLFNDDGVGVTYAHLGGNVPVSDGAIPFWVTGGLGLTHFSPDDSELNSETRFSMNIGLNTQLEITEQLSFRLEGRLYGTFFNSESEVFCDNNACKIYISSNVWLQSEVNAGLTFKF